MKPITIAALAAAMLAPALSHAQSWPERAVTVVIPQSPGSSSDILGRYVADGLSKAWGQPVVIENNPGGNTMIGTGQVTQAAPDGYTLLFHSSSLPNNAVIAENLAFNPREDLQAVAVVAKGDMVILSGTRIELPTLQDVVAKSKEETIFQATTGGTGGLVGSLFMREAGIEMTPVNYKSPPDALIDVAGGRVDFFVTSLTTYLSSAAVGKSTALAISSPERSPTAPDIPTTAEVGFPSVVVEPWWGLFAPTGTPQEILDKINADVNAVMAEPAALAFLETSHSRPTALSVEEANAFVDNDYELSEELLAPAR